MNTLLRLVSVAVLAGAAALPAQAAHMVDFKVDFSTDVGSVAASPFVLNFTATVDLDVATEVHNSTAGLTIHNTNYANPSGLAMTYYREGGVFKLYVGDVANSDVNVMRSRGPGNNDLILEFLHLDSTPALNFFAVFGTAGSYLSSDHAADFNPTFKYSLTPTVTPSAVPEPSSLLLVFAGVGGLAFSARRRGARAGAFAA